jgi:hypothetical protein
LDICANGFAFHHARKAAQVCLFHIAARCFPVNPLAVPPPILNAAEWFPGCFVSLNGNARSIVSGAAFKSMPALQSALNGKQGFHFA